jgi:hypothetical protein
VQGRQLFVQPAQARDMFESWRGCEVAMNLANRFNRPFFFCVFCLIGSQFTSAQQTPFAVQGVWNCYVQRENYDYEFRFEAKLETATMFRASHKLIGTNDPASKGSVGSEADGTIDAKKEVRIYLMKLSGPIGISNFRGDYEATAEIKAGNYLEMQWSFTGTSADGSKLSWPEDCYTEDSNRLTSSTPSITPTPTPQSTSDRSPSVETATATYYRDEGTATPTPTPTPTRAKIGPGELVRRQIEQSKDQSRGCDKKVVATMFGYFSYNPEVDLTKGGSQVLLTFEPYVMPSQGSTRGQAIDIFEAQAQVRAEPDMNLPGSGINFLPAKDNPTSLKWTEHTQWLWNLTQPFWSTVSEEPGTIDIHIHSTTGEVSVAQLPIKIKGKPWWWFVPWIWENILGKPEVGLVLLIFLVTAWRKGMPYALRWIWMHIKREAA